MPTMRNRERGTFLALLSWAHLNDYSPPEPEAEVNPNPSPVVKPKPNSNPDPIQTVLRHPVPFFLMAPVLTWWVKFRVPCDMADG